MKENYAILQNFKLLSVSQGLTGKMTGMPAITTSMLCNAHCQKLSNIIGTVCEKCYTMKYLKSRPAVEKCYAENTDLLTSSIIPIKQLPFINAAMCRLETFGDMLIISKYQEEWDRSVVTHGRNHYAFAYVWNKTDDYCSEFGTVLVQSRYGGITRIG